MADPPWVRWFLSLPLILLIWAASVPGSAATRPLAERVHLHVASSDCFARLDPDLWNTFLILLPDAVRLVPQKLAHVVYRLPAALHASRPLCPALLSLAGSGGGTLSECRELLAERAYHRFMPNAKLMECLRGAKLGSKVADLATREEEAARAANAPSQQD